MNTSGSYDALAAQLRSRPDIKKEGIDVSAIVQAATLAASSHNTQPWKFAFGTTTFASSQTILGAVP